MYRQDELYSDLHDYKSDPKNLNMHTNVNSNSNLNKNKIKESVGKIYNVSL